MTENALRHHYKSLHLELLNFLTGIKPNCGDFADDIFDGISFKDKNVYQFRYLLMSFEWLISIRYMPWWQT